MDKKRGRNNQIKSEIIGNRRSSALLQEIALCAQILTWLSAKVHTRNTTDLVPVSIHATKMLSSSTDHMMLHVPLDVMVTGSTLVNVKPGNTFLQ